MHVKWCGYTGYSEGFPTYKTRQKREGKRGQKGAEGWTMLVIGEEGGVERWLGCEALRRCGLGPLARDSPIHGKGVIASGSPAQICGSPIGLKKGSQDVWVSTEGTFGIMRMSSLRIVDRGEKRILTSLILTCSP
ncbi:hypothetical protein CRG98_029890 [Punica granatum]|uniref:Uncharacterized protein n=1 Tax=Punica granatum TaxID=22663 RepID=A0A2I0J0J4_PUNGR|nr:hypothetical protein CRG98_029890 [Punica granatum]